MGEKTFYPASGVTFATFTNTKPKFTENPVIALTRAQKEGLRYEKKVHEYLQSLLLRAQDTNYELKLSPWIMFKASSDSFKRIRFCQPDAVLVSRDNLRIILCEIKYQHTNDAWKQLRLLYEPVLRHIYPLASIACVEICKWFDPHINFGEHFYYNEDPLQAISSSLGVHIFRPRAIPRRKR